MDDQTLLSFFIGSYVTMGAVGAALFGYIYKTSGAFRELKGAFETFLKFHGYRVDGIPADEAQEI